MSKMTIVPKTIWIDYKRHNVTPYFESSTNSNHIYGVVKLSQFTYSNISNMVYRQLSSRQLSSRQLSPDS